MYLLGSWEKLTKDQNILQIARGYPNSMSLQTKTRNRTKGNKLFNARKGNNLIRNRKFLKEESCVTILSTKYQFLSNIFTVKKRMRETVCDQLEVIKQIHSFPTFQIEQLPGVENSLAKKTSTCAN